MKGMILGAGLGTRLRPLTFEIPKPAIPVLGRPLISYNMEFLSKTGTKYLVINLHRIPGIIKDTISKWGGFKGKISYIIEPDILGTGGGIKNAASHFRGEDYFIILNSDTIIDFDLKKAFRFHESKKSVATMVLFPHVDDRYTPVFLDGDFRLISIGKQPDSFAFRGFYTGVSLLSPVILDILPKGKSCIIQDGIIPAKNSGLSVTGYVTEGLFLEFGTPADYLSNTFRFMELKEETHRIEAESISITPPVSITDNALLGENLTLGPFVSIESGAMVEDGVTLKRTIVWPKGKVKKNSFVENSVITPTRVLKCLPDRERNLL